LSDLSTRTRPFRVAQQPSHRELLRTDIRVEGTAEIDAIIVPAARPEGHLTTAVSLAAGLKVPLIVLCSRAASAREVLKRWGDEAQLIAVDMRPSGVLPRQQSTSFLQRETPFRRTEDTSEKRNFGLALTWLAGWNRVLFLDDDIELVVPDDVGHAAALLDHYKIVGFENRGGFADNSVVCHANRDTGFTQDVFIGAGAMLFSGGRATALFPAGIYNEDWFFLLNRERITSCAVHGRFKQSKFDPYADPDRAASEEFGDCLGEGIFALLDARKRISDADREYWAEFLIRRAELINGIQHKLHLAEGTPEHRQNMADALQAARKSLEAITPELCTEYLAIWRQDRVRWRNWITSLPRHLSVPEALTRLGNPPLSLDRA
jgi:hypothetical protein